MGYEYDSKLNRDLARTAMDIYTKAHDIKAEPINESKEVINEEVLRENINSLILNYVSDAISFAEKELGREMTDVEIKEASIELLNRINSISDEDKAIFVTELAEAHGASMTGMQQAAPMNTDDGRGSGAKPAKPGMRPTGGGAGAGAGRPGAVGVRGNQNVAIEADDDFDPSNYSSIQDYLQNGFDEFGGEGLAQVLAYFGDTSNPGMAQG